MQRLTTGLFSMVLALAFSGGAAAQGMILDMAANKVISKYQGATCERLWAQKPTGRRHRMATDAT